MSNQMPSIGRIVHYVLEDGTHTAAIITAVWGKECINLTAFPANECHLITVTSRMLDEETKNRFTWHWPEVVEDKATEDELLTNLEHARHSATFWYLADLQDVRKLTEQENDLLDKYGDENETAPDGWSITSYNKE